MLVLASTVILGSGSRGNYGHIFVSHGTGTTNMELTPTSEAATQGFPREIMEPEGSLPCAQDPPLVSILSEINPVHTQFYFTKIHFNIILPPTPTSS
jgi:hypothetical protein